MFFQNFKYTLKILLKNKSLLFWIFAFPIILGTLFNLAFSDIESNEKLKVFNIAIVDDDNFRSNKVFRESFKVFSDNSNKNKMFDIKYVDLDQAKILLSDKKIKGYLLFEEKLPKVVVRSNGIEETILKYVTEEIVQMNEIMINISNTRIEDEIKNGNLQINYDEIYKNVMDDIYTQNVKLEDISNDNLSYTMIEFYTLVAMACMYGASISMTAINKTLPNMSSVGKRVSVSPIKKSTIILSSALASYLVQLFGIVLLFLYTIFVLKVDYGNHFLLVLLLSLCGCFAGLSLGIAVTTSFKENENVKNGIILAITMFGSFFAGMMGITTKYVIDKNVPIINKLNPVNMITDGLYSLYYYETFDRYFINLLCLFIFSLVMIIISLFNLRRQKYDSI